MAVRIPFVKRWMDLRLRRLYTIAQLTGYGWDLAVEDFKEMREQNPRTPLPDLFEALEQKMWAAWPGRN